MTPELKFHSVVLGATTGLLFGAWVVFIKVIAAYPVPAVILSAFVSLGVYRALVAVMLALFRHVKWVRRAVLGSSYLEGMWVGFFIGHKHHVRLFVEIFEQDLSDLVIRGRSFKKSGRFHGSWIAGSANFDPKLGRLSYYYEADVIGNSFINPGIACFDIDRPARHRPPERLVGFSSDLFSPAKLRALEAKVSDSTMIDTAAAFKQAQQVYARHKGQF